MKVVILAGGFGTRLAEETELRPKPMVEIGGRPILWHIMKHYAHHGFSEFLIALGYKGDYIKRYFLEYHTLSSPSITVALHDGKAEITQNNAEEWTIHLVDTGLETMTGGRLHRLQNWIGNETFMLTYGDGVSNVDLKALLEFHHAHGKIGTVTAVRPPARFGGLRLNDSGQVDAFTEKPQIGEGWINGGFFIFEPDIFDYLDGDKTVLETHALENLADDGQLFAYRHDDFWQCMDTLREKRYLENLWDSRQAPWKVW